MSIRALLTQICDVASIVRDFSQPDIFQSGWAHQQAQSLRGNLIEGEL